VAECDFDGIQVGETIGSLTLPAVGRATLALFAGASGDHNPIHIDIDFARRAGLPDVFAHGMLSMAWLGRLLTGWMPQSQLRSFNVRFLGLTHLGHVVTCSATVVEKCELHDLPTVKLRLEARNQYGEVRTVGEAVIAFPPSS
jgi:acyl dehydratase